MSDGALRTVDTDFDVVAQAIQAVHQLAFGEVGELAAQ